MGVPLDAQKKSIEADETAASVFLSYGKGDAGRVVESFTRDEVENLAGVVTNTTSNVYAWMIGDRLSLEQAGALMSRISRSSLTGRRLFLREFLPNKERGREFFESWLVSYGDDSIQEMAGGLPVTFEYVSNLMAKAIEEPRIGASFIEKSSRYVPFDKKLPNGEYMYYRDPDIMASKHGDRFVGLMDSLFELYSKNIPVMQKYVAEKNPISERRFLVGGAPVSIGELKREDEERLGVTESDLVKAYDNSVKAQALDILRDYLPLATLTHVGAVLNARAWEALLLKLEASRLTEAQHIGGIAKAELTRIAPSLLRRVSDSHGEDFKRFIRGKEIGSAAMSNAFLENAHRMAGASVSLDEFTGMGSRNADREAQISLCAAILYENAAGLSLEQLKRAAAGMSPAERRMLISAYVGERGNRRQRPGRAFENIEYLFDLVGRVGIFRDIQRHRIGTQQRQPFTTAMGYETRKEFDAIGIADDYRSKMSEVEELFGELSRSLPQQAQYVVTYGFNARWYYRLNARQLFHISELRTGPGGHPDYRKLVQDMFKVAKEVHPSITEHINFIDMSYKELGRLDSEIRTAAKRRAAEKAAK